MDLILQLLGQRNMSGIFITHDLGVVAQCCTEIAIMYCGQIVELFYQMPRLHLHGTGIFPGAHFICPGTPGIFRRQPGQDQAGPAGNADGISGPKLFLESKGLRLGVDLPEPDSPISPRVSP